MADNNSARAEAVKNLNGGNKGHGSGGLIAYRGRGIGWALLDLADAVREHAAVSRERLVDAARADAAEAEVERLREKLAEK